MSKHAYTVASLVFVLVGAILIVYGWLPRYGSLRESEARVIRTVPHPATRYHVELRTPEGLLLACVENSLDQWPPAAINRCPIEKFKPLVGQTVKVLRVHAHCPVGRPESLREGPTPPGGSRVEDASGVAEQAA